MRVIAVDGYIFKLGRKSGMTAMVRPICIYYANFRFGRVALFFFEIVAHKGKVFNRHSKTHFFVVILYILIGEFYKALYFTDVLCLCGGLNKRFGLIKRNLLAFHGVDKVLFYAGKLVLGNSRNGVYGGALD